MVKTIKLVNSIFVLLHVSGVLFGQQKPARENIVKLKRGDVLHADDRLVVAQSDTVVKLPYFVDFYIKKSSNPRADKFYEELQQKAYKRRWTQRLHNIILASADSSSHTDTLATQKSEVDFLAYRGLIIRKIELVKPNVFGPTIYSPYSESTGWLSKTANKIHVKTRDNIIFNHLLFKPGEAIDPYTFADNERILRELPYIEDALIRVIKVGENSDSADVVVFAKDNWSIGLDITTSNIKDFNIDFWDNNIMGSGQEFDNLYTRRTTKYPANNIDGYYYLRNINGSFINCKIGYSAIGYEKYNINIWRNFFTQRTKYAGQLYFERINSYYSAIQVPHTEPKMELISGDVQKCWLGRAFPIEKLGLNITSLSSFIISAGMFRNNYTNRPLVKPDYLYQFQNKTFYLGSITFSNQGFYKSNLVYNYGRAEDIPYGALIRLTAGIEQNEFASRTYSALTLSKAKYIGNAGYNAGSISVGGFIHNNTFEQAVLKINSNFITNLVVLKQFKFRHFLNVNYIKGYNRNTDEYLSINDKEGIRGFEYDTARGTQKFILNIETVCFTPYYAAGFRFAFFTFADFAYIGQSYKNIISSPLYSGFGLGIRLRNERLVFKTFQIRLAYYPKLPRRASGELFNLSDESRFHAVDFNAKSPEIIQFK